MFFRLDRFQYLMALMWKTVFFSLILISSVSVIPLAFAQSQTTPLQQLKLGILPDHVICYNDLILIMKPSNDSPACVKPTTAQKLVERGWKIPNKDQNESTSNSYDIFGVKEIYPTKKDSIQWYMNDNNILNDTLFHTGPDSNVSCDNPQVCMQLYKNSSEDSWHAKRINVSENEGVRLVVNSPPNKLWLNTEMTGYYKLHDSIYYPQEFTHVTRSGSPHTSICYGYSYYSSITYDGDVAGVQKSLYHAGDISSYSKTFIKSGITIPLNDRWFGMKTMTYNVNSTAVKLEIWIDDQDNNNWHKVFEQIDTGWSIPGHPAEYGCKNPLTGNPMNSNDTISWGGTEQQYRADNAEFDFKKLSIREIVPPIS